MFSLPSVKKTAILADASYYLFVNMYTKTELGICLSKDKKVGKSRPYTVYQ
jgi:hypothetical protein